MSGLSVYTGDSSRSSGDMYCTLPGHRVREVKQGFTLASLDMPKSVTLAWVPAIIRMLFPVRSLWMRLL